jgi:hypothetical protein
VRRALFASGLLAMAALGACGANETGTATTVTAAPSTTAAATPSSVGAASTTVAVTTSTVASSAPSTSTIAPSTSSASSTTEPERTTTTESIPCDLELIVEQTGTAFEGVTPEQLSCAQGWATWQGSANDPQESDGYFAVAVYDSGSWVLVNLGTSGVCADGGVPSDLWDELNCVA